MGLAQVMADYTESCSVMREGRIEPSLLAERRKSPEEASIPMRQERVLMHRSAAWKSMWAGRASRVNQLQERVPCSL